MTKRTQQYQLDPNAEELDVTLTVPYGTPMPNNLDDIALQSIEVGVAYKHLYESGVITVTEGAISWREGHLEHVAKLYAANPAQTWRDYADDLTVALAADGSNFTALVDKARGE